MYCLKHKSTLHINKYFLNLDTFMINVSIGVLYGIENVVIISDSTYTHYSHYLQAPVELATWAQKIFSDIVTEFMERLRTGSIKL